MSGRNHHYLPRFLQRHFAYRQSGKEFYVHAHHRVRGPYSPNVAGLGSERDFYGGPEDTALDDAITTGEGRLGDALHRLNKGEEAGQAEMAELVSALSIRTKAMREALKGMFPTMLAMLRERVLSAKFIRQQYRDSLHDPKKRRELLDEILRKEHGDATREQRGKRRAILQLAWPSLVASQEERFVQLVQAQAEESFDRAFANAGSMADKVFLDALGKGPSTPKRVERFAQEMQFDVWEAQEGQFFVLGDCGPVAMFSDGVPRLALGAISDEVRMECVFLPISPTRCLVGRRSASDHGLSTGDVNRMSAVLSHEFVVSHLKEHETLASLLPLIGTQAPIETEEAIFRALSEDEEEIA